MHGGSEVVVAECSSATDKAVDWRRQNHLVDFREMWWFGRNSLWRKPARNGRIGEGGHALRLGYGDALFPLLGGGWRRCAWRIANYPPIEPLGRPLRHSHRGCAAHRQTAKMRTFDAERIHNRKGVGDQSVEAVAAFRRFAASVSALIIA